MFDFTLAVGVHIANSDGRLVGSGLCSSFKSVSDLETAMYQVLESTPCVRLLNLTGEVGCSSKPCLALKFAVCFAPSIFDHLSVLS